MSLKDIIETESHFSTAMPRHAKAASTYLHSDPVMKLQRWAFARAIVRRPDLATVLYVATSGEKIETWISVAPNGGGGWSVLPVLKRVTSHSSVTSGEPTSMLR